MFLNYPKEIELKDGRKVTIRPMGKNDNNKLLKFFRELRPQDRLCMRDDVTNPNTVQKWIEALDYDTVVPLLATTGEDIVADASIHRNTHGWSRHVGRIRVSVHPDFQNTGLGYKMAREIFVIAQSMKIDKVLAEMMDFQKGAIHVFEKLGFKLEHIFKDHVRDQNGVIHNLVVMSVDINRVLSEMESAILDLEDRGGGGGGI
jgi:RimJ/RimL family protein N-acetyltransferase